MENLLNETNKCLDVVKFFKNGDAIGALDYQSKMKCKKTIVVNGIECEILDVVVREKSTGVYSVVTSLNIDNFKLEVK